VTQIGRDAAKNDRMVNEHGAQVIEVDTDGIYSSAKYITVEEASGAI